MIQNTYTYLKLIKLGIQMQGWPFCPKDIMKSMMICLYLDRA